MKNINKAIDMITWSDKEGHIKPIRFRTTDDTESILVIKIDQIVSVKFEGDKKNPIRSFICRSVINELQKEFEIQFHVNQTKWFLSEM